MSSLSIFDETVAPGADILVKAKGKRTCVSRLIVRHLSGRQYVVLTPKGALESEDYSAVSGACYRKRDEDPPLTMGKIAIDFDTLPSQEEFDALCEQAEDIAASMSEGRVDSDSDFQIVPNRPAAKPKILPRPPLKAPQPSQAPAPPVKLTGGLGALATALGGVPGGSKARQSDADSQEPAGDDARVLTVMYDPQGQRFRDFRDAVYNSSSPAWTDWPLTGPRTTLWCLKWMLHRAGSPLSWHLMWVQLGKLSTSDSLVLSHEFSCRMLECATTYDQVDTGALASFEVCARQLQTCEDLLAYKFQEPRDDTNSDLHLMTGAQHKTQLCICPELQAFTANETAKSAAVMKDRSHSYAKDANHNR